MPDREPLDISRLRLATAEDHQAVEGLMPFMQADLRRNDYIRYLDRMYGIVAAWEEQSSLSAPDWLRESLRTRERRAMLTSDLAHFGKVPSEDRSSLPPLDNINTLLGAMYVMEGSTLGGQYIARHVEKVLGLTSGHGNAFFLGHGNQTGSTWKEFCSMLETRVPESETETVILSAKAMFATFGAWIQGIPAPIDS